MLLVARHPSLLSVLTTASFRTLARGSGYLARVRPATQPAFFHRAQSAAPMLGPSQKDEVDAFDPFAPRPPPGYAALRAPPSQLLLPLTISNKCGQAFRWHGVKVWEPIPTSTTRIKAELDEKPDVNALLNGAGLDGSSADGRLPLNPPEAPPQWLEQTEWSLCLSDRVVLLRQDEERGFIYHKTLLPPSSSLIRLEEVQRETERWLKDYLNLEVPLEALYLEWAERDKVFARFADRFTGLRMLRQDPWECLCAFICSSNNNIARIGQMVQNLCMHFSPPLLSHAYPACPIPPSDPATVKAEADVEATAMTIHYHPFPPPEKLAKDGVEDKLRQLGFGYRAKYLATTARMLCEKHRRLHDEPQEVRWDYGIKREDDEERGCASSVEASEGPPASPKKVVDDQEPSPGKRRKRGGAQRSGSAGVKGEVGEGDDASRETGSPWSSTRHSVRSYLESLRKLDYHGARQELLRFPGVGPKVADCILLMSLDQPASIPVDRHVFQFAEKWYSIRSKKYEDIAQRFRNLWGEYAGWAHSVLFTADLRSFATYNAAKKEEQEVAAEERLGDAVLDSLRSEPRVKPEAKTEAELEEAVHSPPRVALPDLVVRSTASASKRRARQATTTRTEDEGEMRPSPPPPPPPPPLERVTVVSSEIKEGATLAERIKARATRRRSNPSRT
ncbi:8-oxoguanine glycosylase ogg1 [Thecaphora frezii]